MLRVKRVSFWKQPHWITASQFLLIMRIFEAAVTKTEHLQRANNLSLAKQVSIAISDNSALWVTAGGWGVFRRCWFSRHWRDNLSKARFTFAVYWQRWPFTPAWSRLAAFCRRIARPSSQSEEPESTSCVASATAACALPLYCVCWSTSEKNNNVVQSIEIIFPMARQQKQPRQRKQRGPYSSNTKTRKHTRQNSLGANDRGWRELGLTS